jgi:hypothetical protein
MPTRGIKGPRKDRSMDTVDPSTNANLATLQKSSQGRLSGNHVLMMTFSLHISSPEDHQHQHEAREPPKRIGLHVCTDSGVL